MRVVDFRAGPSSAKQRLVMQLAAKEGVEKVYTLVERDEVSTWVKMGFAKEANIPAFYKRSDAFLLGSPVVTTNMRSEPPPAPNSSHMRISLRRGMPLLSMPIELTPEEDDDDVAPEHADTKAHAFAEKTLVHAKKRAKDLAGQSLPLAKLAQVTEAQTKKPLAAALKSSRAMTAFERFGRDVERRYFVTTARAGFELVTSIESQACFGNAFLELLTAPKNDAEALATTSALKAICDKLLKEGTVSVFSLVPSDDVALASAFCFNGFRRTGLLLSHVLLGDGASRGERKDAIVFSRKMTNPTSD
ncbi:MAG: hypothetical protein ABI551_01750 [Polyangiaceae bacterium]